MPRVGDARKATFDEVMDARLRGAPWEIPVGDKRVVARWKQWSEDPDQFDSLRVIVVCKSGPITVRITSALDSEELIHRFDLYTGHGQSIETAAGSLSIEIEAVPGGIANVGNASGIWRIDDRCTPPTVWETMSAGLASGAEDEITFPLFTTNFAVWWVEGAAGPIIRGYDPTGAIVLWQYTPPTPGTWYPLNRLGKTTIQGAANQRYSLQHRMYG